MRFTISGLSPEPFRTLFHLSDAALQARDIVRVRADAKPGYPCRISLEDAEPGETLLLLNHESHAVATPYRSQYAIYVRESAGQAARYENELPPILQQRQIALRMFSSAGMLVGADMGKNSDLEVKIDAALARDDVAYLHAHNAMHGCFMAAVEVSA